MRKYISFYPTFVLEMKFVDREDTKKLLQAYFQANVSLP